MRLPSSIQNVLSSCFNSAMQKPRVRQFVFASIVADHMGDRMVKYGTLAKTALMPGMISWSAASMLFFAVKDVHAIITLRNCPHNKLAKIGTEEVQRIHIQNREQGRAEGIKANFY